MQKQMLNAAYAWKVAFAKRSCAWKSSFIILVSLLGFAHNVDYSGL